VSSVDLENLLNGIEVLAAPPSGYMHHIQSYEVLADVTTTPETGVYNLLKLTAGFDLSNTVTVDNSFINKTTGFREIDVCDKMAMFPVVLRLASGTGLTGNTVFKVKLVYKTYPIISASGAIGDRWWYCFDGNGATAGSMPLFFDRSSAEANQNQATLPTNFFTKTGYVFDSWNSQRDGLGTSYAPYDVVNLTANTIFWAKWWALFTGTIMADQTYTIYADQQGTVSST